MTGHYAWMWVDLDGRGPRWHLAIRTVRRVMFPVAEWQDYVENLTDCPVIEIEKPTESPSPARDGESE